jgi:hypothetical protein
MVLLRMNQELFERGFEHTEMVAEVEGGAAMLKGGLE